jgi:Regulator of ribonuclease activity B
MGMFVPRSILRRRPAESLNPASEEDLDRLAELRERGSRLNLPHPVRGFVQFESERAARSGADALRRAGFACTVRAAGDGSWVVTAIRTLVPTPGAVTRLREELESLTAGQDGSYRGWDAPIVC